MFDLTTILRAISIVGDATTAGKALFDQFIPLLHGADQDALKKLYAEARAKSDADHSGLQAELRGAS